MTTLFLAAVLAGGPWILPPPPGVLGDGTAAADIDLDTGHIYSSSGILELGGNMTTGHSLGTGDVGVAGELEVDGVLWADSTFYIGADQAITAAGTLGTYGVLRLAATAQTPDASMLFTGFLTNTWLIAEYADRTTDFANLQQTDPTVVIQSADATDITQHSYHAWNRLSLGGNGGGIGCINQTVAYDDFTDGGGVVGTLVLDEGVPDGAVILQRPILHTLTGFTGGANSTATIQAGDGTDVDRYNAATPDIYTTNASGVAMGAPSGTRWHDDAKNVTLTVTVDNDYTTVAAGAFTFMLCYLTP